MSNRGFSVVDVWGRQLRKNVVLSAMQAAISAVCLFVIFKILIREVGLVDVGIWTLLLSATIATRALDASGSNALSRFVAQTFGTPRESETRAYIAVVLVQSMGFQAVIVLVLLLAAPAVLPMLFDGENLPLAYELFPYALAATLLSGLAFCLLSAVDGTHRADLRAMMVSSNYIVYCGACAIVVPRYGLIGFAVIHCLQYGLLLLLAYAYLSRRLGCLVCAFAQIEWRMVRETLGYGVRLNAIGVLVMLLEPIMKFSINAVGGPANVTIYELASKLVVQLRSFIASATTPLIPAFASTQSSDKDVLESRISKATTYFWGAGLIVILIACCAAPLVSYFVLEELNYLFLGMVSILALGWGVNVHSIPIYLAAQAKGILRWNFVAHLVMCASILVAVFISFQIANLSTAEHRVYATTFGFAVGLVVASFLISFMNPRVLSLAVPLKPAHIGLFGIALVVALAPLGIYLR